MVGWILSILGLIFAAAYVLAGAVAALYESSQTDDPFRVLTLIDWLPRMFK